MNQKLISFGKKRRATSSINSMCVNKLIILLMPKITIHLDLIISVNGSGAIRACTQSRSPFHISIQGTTFFPPLLFIAMH